MSHVRVPRDRLAEREVIGCAVASALGAQHAARHLGPDDFYPPWSEVFAAACALDDVRPLPSNWVPCRFEDYVLDPEGSPWWHKASRRSWGRPDLERVRTVAVADLAGADAEELWALVRARATTADRSGAYAYRVLAARDAYRRLLDLELEQRQLVERWAS